MGKVREGAGDFAVVGMPVGTSPCVSYIITRLLSAARMLSQHFGHSSTCPQGASRMDRGAQSRAKTHLPHQRAQRRHPRCSWVSPTADVTRPVAATGITASA